MNISQPLIRPTPVAAACYLNASSPSCVEVIKQFANSTWRSNQPGAFENINFETYINRNGTVDACYLNVTLGSPCAQGSIPPIGVDARNVQDVQAAVRFARDHNLKLVVKNTGHDYLGRSAGRGAFMLWTHHMKDMSYHEAFVPEGALLNTTSTVTAITVGAGTQWVDAYELANQHGQVLVGGVSIGGTVGAAGGWVMGGGHSVLSPRHGLGVDNVLEFKVVTADGNFLTANTFQNSDLFWALRGGGGGTYGVVTSATYKTHPSFPVGVAFFQTSLNPEVAEEVITATVRTIVNFTDAGWGGYLAIPPGGIGGLWLAPNSSQTEMEAAFTPFASYLHNITGEKAVITYNSTDSYWEWFYNNFVLGIAPGSTQVGGNVYLSSRLLSKDIAQNNPADVARVFLSVQGGVGLNVIAGGAVNTVDPASTGLNPSWRSSVAQVSVAEDWADNTDGMAIQQAAERLMQNTNIIDTVSVNSGAYMNEASLFERDFKKSFFGSHYAGLRTIKQKYDPQSFFVVPSGVSSDEWDRDLNCRLG